MSVARSKNNRQNWESSKLLNTYLSRNVQQKSTLLKWQGSKSHEMRFDQKTSGQLTSLNLKNSKHGKDRKKAPKINHTSSEMQILESENNVKRCKSEPKLVGNNDNKVQKSENGDNKIYEIFIENKAKLDDMVNQIGDKQKLVFSEYYKLVQLQKQLGGSGLNVHLESITFIDYGENLNFLEICKDGTKITLNPDLLISMKNILEKIPFGLHNLCTYLIETQKLIENQLKIYLPNGIDKESLRNILNTLENETIDVRRRLSIAVEEKEELCKKLIIKWAQLLKRNSSESAILKNPDIHQSSHEKVCDYCRIGDKQLLKQSLVEVEQRIVKLENHVYVEKDNKKSHNNNEGEQVKVLKKKVDSLIIIKNDYEKQIIKLSGELRKAEEEKCIISESKNNMNRNFSTKMIEITKKNIEADKMLMEQNSVIKDLHKKLNEKENELFEVKKKNLDLENQLSTINEKKAKLQETVNFIETELMATKAQISDFDSAWKKQKKNANKLK